MPVTINVNNLTLCHKGSNGVSRATIPDVCKTPSPGGPVPLPYPNIAMSMDLMKGTTTVKADGGMMCANYGSEFFKSTGDEPGVAGGVVSSTFIKEATWITFSFDVKLQGKAACRLTDKMFHNHQNTVNMGGLDQPDLELSPPGDCTPAQHKVLQDDVNQKCKSGKRSCKGVQDCASLSGNIKKNMDCALARELIAKTCYRGGDRGHRIAIEEALNAAAYCEAQFIKNCRPKPLPVPEPVPKPVPDSDFWQKMSELTGLTGTALLIYVIISEGSRIIPPRNLIPVP